MDKCKLCKENDADKTNSHIVPKWLAKTMMNTGSGYKVVKIDTNKTHLPRTKTQDIDTEDYILCSSCEQYFGVIETWFKSDVHDPIHNNKKINNYTKKNNGAGGINWIEFNAPAMLSLARLFFYSILWRISISNNGIWINTHLKKVEEEYFRETLVNYKCLRKTDLVSHLNNIKFENSPWFVLFTCPTHRNKLENFIGEYPLNYDLLKLVLNEYIIVVSFPPNKEQEVFEILNNKSNDELLKITIVTEDFWQDQKNQLIKFLKKQSINSLLRSGNIYYPNNK